EWLGRMKFPRRDVGTGRVDAEVDELCAQIDLDGLRGYWDAVQTATLAIAETLRDESLEAVVPADQIRATAVEEGAVAPAAPWLVGVWGEGGTRGWDPSQFPFPPVCGEFLAAHAVRGLWGDPSPGGLSAPPGG